MGTVPVTTITEEVLEFLAAAPSPQEILSFHASPAIQERLRYLLDQNRNGTLSREEGAELDEMERMDHFITLLKARTRKKHIKI